jgi:hypothetical protein
VSINKENLELWINALESDEFEQITGYNYDGENRACTIGVGFIVAERARQGHRKFYGFDSDLDSGQNGMDLMLTYKGGTASIIYLNDLAKLSFWEIAQLMREQYLKDEE